MAEAHILWKAIRPKQWTKNLIVFAPLLFAGKLHDAHAALSVSACFAAFCCLSSAVYLFNDIIDRESDKFHPLKSARPIAAGELSPAKAALYAALLCFISLATSWMITPLLFFVFLLYIAVVILYNACLKKFPLLDIFCIAAGFVIRALAGAVAAFVYASTWFLLCTVFGALFLALEKRKHELRILGKEAQAHRPSLNLYSSQLLIYLKNIVLTALIICYGAYCIFSEHGPLMLITLPFVLYGILHYQKLSKEGNVTGTPEEVLLTDKTIQITITLWIAASAIAVIYG